MHMTNPLKVLNFHVKYFLHLRPQSVILNEAPDEGGKWKCLADLHLDAKILI